MEIGDRILILRKKLGLNQADFGKCIGVTRSAICNYENGSRSIGEQSILAICREFKVNDSWLRYGNEPMLQQNEQDILERVSSVYELTYPEQTVIASFLKLNRSDRAAIMRYVDDVTENLTFDSSAQDSNAKTTVENGEMPANSENEHNENAPVSEPDIPKTEMLYDAYCELVKKVEDMTSQIEMLKRENEDLRRASRNNQRRLENIEQEDELKDAWKSSDTG